MGKAKKDKLIGCLLGIADKNGHFHSIDNGVFKMTKTYDWWLDISTRIIKTFYKTDKLELIDSDFEHKKYTFIFKNGLERYIAQAIKQSNVVLLFNTSNNRTEQYICNDDGTFKLV